MPMMNIRIVRMRMPEIGVTVRMYMRTLAVPGDIMLMLVMGIMFMSMCMGHRVMRMRMLVRFGQVQPDAGAHQRRSDPEQEAGDFTEH